MGGNVSHKPHNSQVEVTHTEEEGCVVSGVSSSHPADFDDMVMEDDEDREWFLKGIAYHTVVFKEFVDTLPFIKHAGLALGTSLGSTCLGRHNIRGGIQANLRAANSTPAPPPPFGDAPTAFFFFCFDGIVCFFGFVFFCLGRQKSQSWPCKLLYLFCPLHYIVREVGGTPTSI
ncbi:hypothetical protein G0U57_011041 [Chelydra serpentina]|uniref:Uncharacterized protein n=1 Tax=Chelydra serpentina TaxID=8475 RepID=A0A8T1SD76_CHESE|nr:hypothetical protein G0U57_011041 [Chelydra serpentina]